MHIFKKMENECFILPITSDKNCILEYYNDYFRTPYFFNNFDSGQLHASVDLANKSELMIECRPNKFLLLCRVGYSKRLGWLSNKPNLYLYSIDELIFGSLVKIGKNGLTRSVSSTLQDLIQSVYQDHSKFTSILYFCGISENNLKFQHLIMECRNYNQHALNHLKYELQSEPSRRGGHEKIPHHVHGPGQKSHFLEWPMPWWK